jgi:hypothetical protein
MASPTCPHCQNTRFVLTTEQVSGATFALAFISCSGCGAPAAVLQSVNPNYTIQQEALALSQQIGALATAVAALPALIAALKP